MIRESELIAICTCLERHVLMTWIDEGLVAPHRDDTGYLFDRIDQSRVELACDLHYRMGLDHASLPVILSLIDQLHEARHCLRALSRAVADQPDTVQSEITRHVAKARSTENGPTPRNP